MAERSTLTVGTFYSHYHIRFNIYSKNNDLGFNSFQKATFLKKKSNLNALGIKQI